MTAFLRRTLVGGLLVIVVMGSIAYLIWYPGLGNIKGRGNWSSQAEYAADKKAADEKIAQAWAEYVAKPIDVAQLAEAIARCTATVG